ncbi:hypothetical protein ACFLZZ_00140 [Nanoarchaeota archaeon]
MEDFRYANIRAKFEEAYQGLMKLLGKTPKEKEQISEPTGECSETVDNLYGKAKIIQIERKSALRKERLELEEVLKDSYPHDKKFLMLMIEGYRLRESAYNAKYGKNPVSSGEYVKYADAIRAHKRKMNEFQRERVDYYKDELKKERFSPE